MNASIFDFFYGFAHKNAALDSVIVFLATDLSLIIIAAILFYLYHHHDKRRGAKEILVVLLSAVLAWIAARLVKTYFPAFRPELSVPGVVPLFNHGIGADSFPSGHVTLLTGFAAAFWRYHKRLGQWLLAVALVVGFARVAAGLHFPIDVLGGLVLGGFLGHYLARYFARNLGK